MIYPFLAVSAVVPSLLLMWFFHARDVYPEPPRMLWTVFGGGILIVLPVLGLAGALDLVVERVTQPLPRGFLEAFLLAAIPEEGFKLLVVWGYAARRPEFDEPMDGVVYGVAASLGFATFENLLYVGQSGFAVALMRALTAVPSHAFLGAIMGYYVGRARFAESGRGRWLWTAFWVPTLLHGLYDTPLLAARQADRLDPAVGPLIIALVSIAPLIVIGEWILALRLSRRLRVAQIRRLPPERKARVPHRRWASILLTVGGTLAASLGGLLALGFALAFAMGEIEPQQVGPMISAGTLVALTPLAGGVAVFAWGVKRLNEGGGSAQRRAANEGGGNA